MTFLCQAVAQIKTSMTVVAIILTRCMYCVKSRFEMCFHAVTYLPFLFFTLVYMYLQKSVLKFMR